MRILAVLVLASGVMADTVILKSGVKVRGQVTESGGTVAVALDGTTRTFEKDQVKAIQRGVTAREEYSRRAGDLGADDAAGWYKLGLWAREKKLSQSRDAFTRVLGIDSDHRAARRALGFERVGDEWVDTAEAKRRKGFVLAGGKWVLPEEADRLMRDGLMEQAPVTEEHRKRAREIVIALQEDDPDVRAAAAEMMDELPDAAVLRPLKRLLYAPHAETRMFAIKKLGRIGDRVALPWLIRSSMYDASSKVRAVAFRSIAGFRDPDVFYPYARALFSRSPVARTMAAQAIAELGDMRGVDVILRRISIGIGEAGRANISVLTQNSYVQDFDVEIAQAAAIGDPIIQTIRDGVILDYKILGGYGEAWIVEERGVYANALSTLTRRDYGQNWKKYRQFAIENDLPRVKLK